MRNVHKFNTGTPEGERPNGIIKNIYESSIKKCFREIECVDVIGSTCIRIRLNGGLL